MAQKFSCNQPCFQQQQQQQLSLVTPCTLPAQTVRDELVKVKSRSFFLLVQKMIGLQNIRRTQTQFQMNTNVVLRLLESRQVFANTFVIMTDFDWLLQLPRFMVICNNNNLGQDYRKCLNAISKIIKYYFI